jgi:hypothetical protein
MRRRSQPGCIDDATPRRAAWGLVVVSKRATAPCALLLLRPYALTPRARATCANQAVAAALLLLCAGAHATTTSDVPNNDFPGGNTVFSLQNSTVTPGVVTICMCVPAPCVLAHLVVRSLLKYSYARHFVLHFASAAQATRHL